MIGDDATFTRAKKNGGPMNLGCSRTSSIHRVRMQLKKGPGLQFVYVNNLNTCMVLLTDHDYHASLKAAAVNHNENGRE